MEEEIIVDKNSHVKKQLKRNNININISWPLRLSRPYDNTLNRKENNQNFTSYNIASENNTPQINLEKYNNIYPVIKSPEMIHLIFMDISVIHVLVPIFIIISLTIFIFVI